MDKIWKFGLLMAFMMFFILWAIALNLMNDVGPMKDVGSLNICCGIDPPNDFWGKPITRDKVR